MVTALQYDMFFLVIFQKIQVNIDMLYRIEYFQRYGYANFTMQTSTCHSFFGSILVF